MLPGISTACLYPMNTEDSLDTLAALRPACIEVFINAESELVPAFLRGLRTRADDAGIKIVSLHPHTSGMEPTIFFSRYQRRYEDGREFYRKFYAAATILGADSVVFHGDYAGNRLPPQEYFERFGQLVLDAAKEGVQLCQENVSRCLSGGIDFIAQMRKSLPDVSYILDVKQAVRAGEDVFEMASLMGEKLRCVHMSDHTVTEHCLPPGRGVFNISKFLKAIAKIGFSGGVIVELYGENFDGIVELSAAYEHICTMFST